MNNDKIIEGNKLIAEFMGGHLSDHPELNGVKVWHGYDLVEGRLNLPTTLTFHSDWNMLMHVCIKLGMEFVNTDIVLTYNNVIDGIRGLEKDKRI